MEIQSIKSQKGEVEFRKKLTQQQVERKVIFNDEYDAIKLRNEFMTMFCFLYFLNLCEKLTHHHMYMLDSLCILLLLKHHKAP